MQEIWSIYISRSSIQPNIAKIIAILQSKMFKKNQKKQYYHVASGVQRLGTLCNPLLAEQK